MNFKFTKKNIGLLILFIFIFVAGLILYNYRHPSKEIKSSDKLKIVNDYSRFFTISNAGNKYINYLKNQDKDSLMLILSENYQEVNNITKVNILNKLALLDKNKEYSFEARKMYEEKINKNLIRYYIMGYLTEVVMDEYNPPSDYYLIIDFNPEDRTYSVTPYNGKIFKEES